MNDQKTKVIGSLLKMSVLATAGMTLFSYLLSVKKKEKFLEPLALNQLLYPKSKRAQAHHLMGYLVHYLVGLFFSFFYFHLFNQKIISGKWRNFTWMGFINGIIGSLGWYLSIKIHSNPPKIKLGRYFLQLIVAHIIFGIINGAIFKSVNK